MLCGKALAGAQAGIRTLEDRGVPWLRPPDYYAEMVKSDGHMANIKQRLFHEQKRIEEAEERCILLVHAHPEGGLTPNLKSGCSP